MKCVRDTCRNHAIKGATVCRVHGGRAPQVAANAAVRAELARWTLGDPVDNPGETLLRLITQSRVRADLYAAELDRLAAADPGRPLTDVLTRPSWGEGGQTGEYARSIVQLEAQERDRCARFCKLAIDAGLAERMVRLAERQAEVMAEVLRGALADAGLADEAAAEVLAHAGRRLRLAAG